MKKVITLILLFLCWGAFYSINGQRYLNGYAGNKRVVMLVNFWNEALPKKLADYSIEQLNKLKEYPVSYSLKENTLIANNELMVPVITGLSSNQIYFYRVYIDVFYKNRGAGSYEVQRKSSLERLKSNARGIATLGRIYSIAPMKIAHKGSYPVRIYVKMWKKKPASRKVKPTVEAACFILIRNNVAAANNIKDGKYVYSPMIGNFAWIKKKKVLLARKKSSKVYRVLTPFDHESFIEKKYINQVYDKL